MEGVNNYRLTMGCKPIAVRETENEMAKVITAHNISKENKCATMLDFVHVQDTQNGFNQITHAVDSHIDPFPGGQSFKNRMCVVHKHLHGCGRGGGLFTAEYTWCIVDCQSDYETN